MDTGLNVLRQNRIQYLFEAGLESVQRSDIRSSRCLFIRIGHLGLVFHDFDRQHAQHAHLLHHHVDELGVDDVEFGNSTLLSRLHVGVHQGVGDRFSNFHAGLVGVAFPRRRDVTITVLVVRRTATPVHEQLRLLACRIEAGQQRLRFTDNRRGVRAGHTTIRGEGENSHARVLLVLHRDRMRDMGVGHQRLHGIENRIGVRLRVQGHITGLGDMRRRDHLLSVEDLRQRLGGADA